MGGRGEGVSLALSLSFPFLFIGHLSVRRKDVENSLSTSYIVHIADEHIKKLPTDTQRQASNDDLMIII